MGMRERWRGRGRRGEQTIGGECVGRRWQRRDCARGGRERGWDPRSPPRRILCVGGVAPLLLLADAVLALPLLLLPWVLRAVVAGGRVHDGRERVRLVNLPARSGESGGAAGERRLLGRKMEQLAGRELVTSAFTFTWGLTGFVGTFCSQIEASTLCFGRRKP